MDWLSDRLGLAVLKENEGTGVSANPAARALLGRDSFPSMDMVLRQVLGNTFDRAQIDDAVTQARVGASAELIGPLGERVLLSQLVAGRAIAVLVPARTAKPSLSPSRATNPDIAAGVSHELANALGAIAGWARLAKQGRRVHEALDLIEMSAESAWSAAQRVLRDLRSQREPVPESVDLSAFVDEAARLLGPKAMGKNVQIRTAIEPGLRVRGDRGSAWSIVWNLAANAIEALQPGGTVELRLSRGSDTAVLEVEDDGPGMSPEHRQRAFEPYFTTKPTGTGLGLGLVRQAATEVGGTVELKSEVGIGTRFTVVLPLVPASAARQANIKRSSGVFFAEPLTQRILVIDDDLGLREMISTALGMRGAEVVAVDRAEAALAQQEPFAVAIVDLLLPGMRGDALLARLREAGLTDVGMLMTGTELPTTLAAGGRPDVLLRKPFELEELFEGLAAALNAERGARRVG
jgi:two-component system cell cycle sensor histidine kinase/response regulator CckA